MTEREMFAEWAWDAFEDESERPEDEWVDKETNPLIARAWQARAGIAEAREDGLRDMLDDSRDLLRIVANVLGVEDEPHQTWADRLLCAAKYSKPGIERSGTG